MDAGLWLFLSLPLLFTFVLSALNLFWLFTRPTEGRRRALQLLEPLGIGVGGLFFSSALSFGGVTESDWQESVVHGELHTPWATLHLPTVLAFVVLAFVGYLILRYVPLRKLPPLLAVLSMGAVTIGLALTVIASVQLGGKEEMLLCQVYLINCMVISLRLLRDVVIGYARGEGRASRFVFWNRLLSRTVLLPPLVLLAILPLTLLVVGVMMLFGQQPDSVIRVWTETADWTFSQMTSPPAIPYEGHYLCTVAATGHRRLVKPLRTGKRHGHTVVVNRQLCVANAFEDLIKERLPRFHRVVRKTYDTLGLPIAKRVRRATTCDLIYLLMKPAEWLFLAMLYLFDSHPENRIALQYPHAPLPQGDEA